MSKTKPLDCIIAGTHGKMTLIRGKKKYCITCGKEIKK